MRRLDSNRMPSLATSELDKNALQIIGQWIDQLQSE